jgi:hypothetical protein
MAFAGGMQAVHADTIVVYGASGKIGGVIVDEALGRGHTVIGVARDTSKLKKDNKNFKAVEGDVTELDSFKKVTQGADAVIISVSGGGDDKIKTPRRPKQRVSPCRPLPGRARVPKSFRLVGPPRWPGRAKPWRPACRRLQSQARRSTP